ncbi:hypothetical protein BDV41DRAFT_570054 [Aspergillus transmontanensis]|uniref:Uncharacterized protein n=1 Tax=Aspergillus transmontanensis TaxID=1034304 RepID=A0A5N6VGC9_9EURO|nr:hypothetical protein BDV41DRAFT_570054 [Aspergillus transmontanensis]
METSPPPPYPGPPEQTPVVDIVKTTATQPEDPDLETHPHTLLVSITHKDAQILPTVLHYWNHDSSIAILTKPTEAQLDHIRGFEKVGTFPPPGNRKAIDEVISRLRGGGDITSSRDCQVEFCVFVITVFGVESEGLLTGGLAPVWKWAKPERLQLLVQGVSEERKQKLRRARSKSMSIV